MNTSGRYHSPLRVAQLAATRDRIVRAAAQAAAAHGGAAPAFAEVAQRAGVNERTVYRHFPTEAALQEAATAQLEADAGWPEQALDAAALPELVRRTFAAFGRHRPAGSEPARSGPRARRRELLLEALRPLGRGLPRERAVAAAALVQLLSSAEAYRQLAAWGLDGRAAAQAAAGATELVVAELRRQSRRAATPPRRRR